MTPDEALRRLTALCSRTEQCTADTMRHLARWQVPQESRQQIIQHLTTHHYIDHQRYADAFAHDKFKFNHWGAERIKRQLQAKHIEPRIIDNAILQISEEDTLDTLRALLQMKRKTVKGKTPYEINTKLMRFALNKGFTISQIKECLNLEGDDECDA